jgi:heme exporter protein CcmD
MDFSANHTGFVIASYGLTFLVLGVLIATTLIRDRRLRAEAARLDAGRRTQNR